MPSSTVDIPAKLKSIEFLKKFDDATIKELAQGLSFVRHDSDTALFMAGDTADRCYLVSYGSIKLVKNAGGGKEVVMCFCRAGDFVGAGIMAGPITNYPITALTLEDSGLILIPRSVFMDKWQKDPSIAQTIHTNVMNRMMEFQQDKAMAVSSVPQRIASFLLRSLDQQPSIYGNTLDLKLTRKDIAERVSTSVETVIRCLSQWSQNEWISTTDHRITIKNRKALEGIIHSKD